MYVIFTYIPYIVIGAFLQNNFFWSSQISGKIATGPATFLFIHPTHFLRTEISEIDPLHFVQVYGNHPKSRIELPEIRFYKFPHPPNVHFHKHQFPEVHFPDNFFLECPFSQIPTNSLETVTPKSNFSNAISPKPISRMAKNPKINFLTF